MCMDFSCLFLYVQKLIHLIIPLVGAIEFEIETEDQGLHFVTLSQLPQGPLSKHGHILLFVLLDGHEVVLQHHIGTKEHIEGIGIPTRARALVEVPRADAHVFLHGSVAALGPVVARNEDSDQRVAHVVGELGREQAALDELHELALHVDLE